MKHKIKLFLTSLVTSVILIGSLGLAVNPVHAQEELTVWAWDPNFNIRALEIAEEIYQEEHPDFHLNIVESAQDDVVQKINTSLSSGVTDGLPQIVLIEDYRAQSFLEAYPDSFFPLSDFFPVEDFADYKIQPTTYEGEHYAIPFDSGVTGLYVRRDLLDQAGYDLDDVTDVTWQELKPIAEDLKEATGAKLFSVDLNDLNIVRAMIQASGSWYTEDDGLTPDLADNDAIKDAFTFLGDMLEADLLNIHNDWAQMLQAFNSGQVAMITQGNWITPSVTAEEDLAGQWAVVPWPRQEVDASVNASNMGGSSFYVINAEGKEAAAEFLGATFGSSEDFYRELLQEIGAIGAYLPLLETDAYDQAVDYFDGQAIYKDFAEWSQEIPAVTYGSYTYAIEDVLKNALQDYLHGGDLDEILERAQETAENQLP